MTERMYSENVCKSHRLPVLSQQLEIASLSFEIEIQILLLLLLKNSSSCSILTKFNSLSEEF